MKEFIREYLIILISINLTSHHIFSCILIKVDYHFHYSIYKAEIEIGKLALRYFVIIDLTSQYTWINSLGDYDALPEEEQSKISNSQLIYDHNEYKAKQVENLFGFCNYRGLLKDFNYFYITRSVHSIDTSMLPMSNGVIGLAYQFTNEKYSLIHQLKDKGIIDHLAFSIVDTSQIYLGGISPEDTIDRYQSSCDVIDNSSNETEAHWACSLRKVIIRNNTQTLTHLNGKDCSVSFTLEQYRNYAPKSFIDFIKSNYYSKELQTKKYSIYQIDGMERISSVDDGSVIHGNITFVIGDYAYAIDIDSFWDCYEIACDFTLFENPYGDYWMLGVWLFSKKYHVLFDYEQRKVTFYSKKEMLVYNDIEEYNEISKAMLIVICVILSIGVGWLFWGIKRLLI